MGDDELWGFASWSYEFERDESAWPLYRAYQSRYQDSAEELFYIGREPHEIYISGNESRNRYFYSKFPK